MGRAVIGRMSGALGGDVDLGEERHVRAVRTDEAHPEEQCDGPESKKQGEKGEGPDCPGLDKRAISRYGQRSCDFVVVGHLIRIPELADRCGELEGDSNETSKEIYTSVDIARICCSIKAQDV